MIGFWTPEQDGELKRLADEGLSAAQIAAKLGFSRSAVVGRVYRLQGKVVLQGRRRGAARPRPPSASTEPAPIKPVVRRRRAPQAVKSPLPKPADPSVAALPVDRAPVLVAMTFAEAIERDRCLYFAGPAYAPGGPDMPVCGHERAAGRTRYCARHHLAQYEAKP